MRSSLRWIWLVALCGAPPATMAYDVHSLSDGASRSEAAEQAAERAAGITPDEEVFHPRSVVHRSAAQNPLPRSEPSRASAPRYSWGENSPSSEPIGRWRPERQVGFDRAAMRIENAATRVEAAVARAEIAADRAERAASRAEQAARGAEERFTRAILK